MQPTIVVVNAELYCVQSTVEYIRTNLQNKMLSYYSWLSACSSMKSDFDTATQLTTSDYGLLTMAMMLHLNPRYNSTATRTKPDVQCWHGTSLAACTNTLFTLRSVFLPHDAREDELAEEKHIWPAFVFHCLRGETQHDRTLSETHRNHAFSINHLWVCLAWHSMEDRAEKIR